MKLCETKMNDRLKKHKTKLQLELDAIRSDLTLLKTKHTETDTQSEAMIEVNPFSLTACGASILEWKN